MPSSLPYRRPDRWLFSLAALALVLVPMLVAAPAAEAQPFGSWINLQKSPVGYIQVAHHPALNPAGQITIEGWVNLQLEPGSCDTIIGKNWRQAWWVASCSGELRSYIRGETSLRQAGTIAGLGWTHFAVTFDGTTRRHYINGELAGSWVEPGALSASASPLRIGSDVEWTVTPNGAINEIRLWNVARTQAQLRSTINVPLTAPQAGLVAVWAGGGPNDVVGIHDGVIVGTVTALTFPVALGCTTTATELCLHDRFLVTVDWRTDGPPVNTGQGQVAPLTTSQSGIFWFFEPDNWEVMVKVLDACILNDRFWAFSAATTNVFYRMEVLDVEKGVNKVYFNYPGPPAPAVTDTAAFDTCP